MMYGYIPLVDGDGIGTTPAHAAIAQHVMPINDKILFISIGASSSASESDVLLQYINEGKLIGEVNPDVTFINCAIGARDVNDWSDPGSNKYADCWAQTENRLISNGFAFNDVQIIWLKEDDLQDKADDEGRVDRLFWKYVTLLQLLKTKFPNLKRTYISGRSCVLTNAESTHAEPKPYYTGLAAKKIVQEQIAGNPYLTQDLVGWVSDVVYLWTDGGQPRSSDGYMRTLDSWKGDGVHPNDIGNAIVADFIYNRLLNCTDWFPNTIASEKTIAEYDSTTYTPMENTEYPGDDNVIAGQDNNNGLIYLIGLGALGLYLRKKRKNKTT